MKKLINLLSDRFTPMPQLKARMKFLENQKEMYLAIINMSNPEQQRAEHKTKVEQVNIKS